MSAANSYLAIRPDGSFYVERSEAVVARIMADLSYSQHKFYLIWIHPDTLEPQLKRVHGGEAPRPDPTNRVTTGAS